MDHLVEADLGALPEVEAGQLEGLLAEVDVATDCENELAHPRGRGVWKSWRRLGVTTPRITHHHT